MYKGVTTVELDELAAETSASLTARHPDYAIVSGGTSPQCPVRYPCLACLWLFSRLTFLPASVRAARCQDCCLQPAQDDSEELQRDVRKPSNPTIATVSSDFLAVWHQLQPFADDMSALSPRVKIMYNHINSATGEPAPLVNEEFYKFVMENSEKLDSSIIYDRDFDYDYFGFKVTFSLDSRACYCSKQGPRPSPDDPMSESV